ncbi:MAG: hypothetical protein WCT49_04795 [Candidatus Paceibacterota bacterium]|jgi:hypothetical protein
MSKVAVHWKLFVAGAGLPPPAGGVTLASGDNPVRNVGNFATNFV